MEEESLYCVLSFDSPIEFHWSNVVTCWLVFILKLEPGVLLQADCALASSILCVSVFSFNSVS